MDRNQAEMLVRKLAEDNYSPGEKMILNGYWPWLIDLLYDEEFEIVKRNNEKE